MSAGSPVCSQAIRAPRDSMDCETGKRWARGTLAEKCATSRCWTTMARLTPEAMSSGTKSST